MHIDERIDNGIAYLEGRGIYNWAEMILQANHFNINNIHYCVIGINFGNYHCFYAHPDDNYSSYECGFLSYSPSPEDDFRPGGTDWWTFNNYWNFPFSINADVAAYALENAWLFRAKKKLVENHFFAEMPDHRDCELCNEVLNKNIDVLYEKWCV